MNWMCMFHWHSRTNLHTAHTDSVCRLRCFNVGIGHKYFNHETTKLPAIFHYEVIIMLPYVCLYQQDAWAYIEIHSTRWCTCVCVYACICEAYALYVCHDSKAIINQISKYKHTLSAMEMLRVWLCTISIFVLVAWHIHTAFYVYKRLSQSENNGGDGGVSSDFQRCLRVVVAIVVSCCRRWLWTHTHCTCVRCMYATRFSFDDDINVWQ